MAVGSRCKPAASPTYLYPNIHAAGANVKHAAGVNVKHAAGVNVNTQPVLM